LVTVAGSLARLAEEPQRAALFLDVDGTLAPIVARPEDARVPDATREILRALVSRYSLVACVSGRPGPEAERIVGVDGIRYIGEHGLELAPEADTWAERLQQFERTVAWPAEAGKRLTLSFHYRTAANPEAARVLLEETAVRALADGFRPRWGRMVLEVRPPIEADKGTAVRQLLRESRLRRALYAGDDTTDLDAFHALDRLELAVRVAVSSDEGPSELGEAADLVVGSPEALAEVLARL
jgi:trehalose 6-phosphate phosphatase